MQGDVEVLRDYSAALGIFEEHANGGFQFIEAELDRNVSSEELANDAIADLETLYQGVTWAKAMKGRTDAVNG